MSVFVELSHLPIYRLAYKYQLSLLITLHFWYQNLITVYQIHVFFEMINSERSEKIYKANTWSKDCPAEMHHDEIRFIICRTWLQSLRTDLLLEV